MDIQTKKPQVINLKGKKLDLPTPKPSVKIEIEPVKTEIPEPAGKFSCCECNMAVVDAEFQRCPSCEVVHKNLCTKLDARPIQKKEKVREELFAIKSIKRGVEFTDLVTREDARALGIKLPD